MTDESSSSAGLTHNSGGDENGSVKLTKPDPEIYDKVTERLDAVELVGGIAAVSTTAPIAEQSEVAIAEGATLHELPEMTSQEATTSLQLSGVVVNEGAVASVVSNTREHAHQPTAVVLNNTEEVVGTIDSTAVVSPMSDQMEDHKDYSWEKPEWATKSILQKTETNIGTVSEGDGEPVSPRKEYKWAKPTWTDAELRATEKGETVKKGADLQGKITHVEKNKLYDVNFEANPMILRPTEKGAIVRLEGKDLQGKITQVERDIMGDINFEANQMLLRPTELGSALRQGADIQGPITHVERNELDDFNLEANPMLLRPTEQGAVVRLGQDLAKPITHIQKIIKKKEPPS